MTPAIEIYQTPDHQTRVEVRFEEDTVWLTQAQLVALFKSSKANISEHIKSIYQSGELQPEATVRKFRTVRQEGSRRVTRELEHYNLDMIISIGYRVNSKRGIQFRQWATRRLKDFLVQGYALNEQRLAEKHMQVEVLKSGIRILHRALEEKQTENALALFAAGLELLDRYDHQNLTAAGTTVKKTIYPSLQEYLNIIRALKTEYHSGVFAIPKDHSFESAIAQIAQTFDGKELYPSIEEKAAMLLYLIVKNHAFADGNKRIGAACFLHFLHVNGLLFNPQGLPIITNETLAALTLFVAVSRPEEKDLVVKLIISLLNNKSQSSN